MVLKSVSAFATRFGKAPDGVEGIIRSHLTWYSTRYRPEVDLFEITSMAVRWCIGGPRTEHLVQYVAGRIPSGEHRRIV
jgi:hypothetical protein